MGRFFRDAAAHNRGLSDFAAKRLQTIAQGFSPGYREQMTALKVAAEGFVLGVVC